MRGRIRKPTALKELQGNAGHRSKADRTGTEPSPPSGAPEPPAHLDDRASRKWFERVAIMMQVQGWLTLFDSDVLAAYCSAYSQWQQAEEQLPLITAQMATAKRNRGRLLATRNALLGQRKQAMKDMKTFGQEIGWSSASRTRIRLNDGQLPLPGLNSGRPDDPPPLSPLERARMLAGA